MPSSLDSTVERHDDGSATARRRDSIDGDCNNRRYWMICNASPPHRRRQRCGGAFGSRRGGGA
ncbi:hypothetical protein C7S16_6668 [Burkholderia thailandensis]|uniref:Uncharacterized protein n=1 Tax=Burkholderia thailandensis TaxID=57975 RepID=A0AAW9CWN9_BURTH|nr:hypothetical protein [Burkholderia thailandensis]